MPVTLLAKSPAAIRRRPQPFSAYPLERVDLRQNDGDVLPLLIQHCTPFGEHLQEFDQLDSLTLGRFVQIEELPDLAQGKAEPLAAQDELDAHALALAVDAAAPAAARSEQTRAVAGGTDG